MKHTTSGFTLIELLVVIGVIAILAAIVLVAVNPGRQFAQARDTQRRSDLYSITNAIYQYAAENQGNLPDTDGDPETESFPVTPTCIGTDTVAGCFNLAGAGDGVSIVPTYLAEIPVDPSTGSQENTQYFVHLNENDNVVVSATGELEETITLIR